MSLTMQNACTPALTRTLNAMLSWLEKAEEYAQTKGFEPDNYVGLRMAPDMFAFARQIQIASDAAKGAVARLTGTEPPSWPDDEDTLAALRGRIQKTIDYVDSIPAASFEGAETREIVMPAGPDVKVKLAGQEFLTAFALPNFYFHASMTYAILRQAGVDLGKRDFLGAVEMEVVQ